MRISNSFIPKFIFMEYCAILKRNLYIASSHYCLNQTFTFHERCKFGWMCISCVWRNLEAWLIFAHWTSLNVKPNWWRVFSSCNEFPFVATPFWSFCKLHPFFATEMKYLYLDGSQPLLYFVPCLGFSQSSWLDYLYHYCSCHNYKGKESGAEWRTLVYR